MEHQVARAEDGRPASPAKRSAKRAPDARSASACRFRHRTGSARRGRLEGWRRQTEPASTASPARTRAQMRHNCELPHADRSAGSFAGVPHRRRRVSPERIRGTTAPERHRGRALSPIGPHRPSADQKPGDRAGGHCAAERRQDLRDPRCAADRARVAMYGRGKNGLRRGRRRSDGGIIRGRYRRRVLLRARREPSALVRRRDAEHLNS